MPSSSGAKADVRPGSSSIIPSPADSSNSWETRVFDEDANSLGAGIWPPRAYPCSFCRREFRSAQALGGHMNVHRRDRARLRYSSPPQSPSLPSTCLIQSQKYILASPSAQESHLRTRPLPTSMSSILPPVKGPYSSVIGRRSSRITSPLPLRLHQLASEAASSLMQFPPLPCSSADLLSDWPTSTTDSTKIACQYANLHATPSKALEATTIFYSPTSSRVISSARPSQCTVSGTTPAFCRRDAPAMEAYYESPKKKSCTDGNIHCNSKFSGSYSQREDNQLSAVEIDGEDDTTSPKQRTVVCYQHVDLELRLGQGPSL